MSSVRLPRLFLLSALLALVAHADSWPQWNRPRPTSNKKTCQTPAPFNKPGSCIPIEKCEPILTLFRENRNSPEVRQYAQQSQCGYNRESRYPSVCCPNDGEVPDIFDSAEEAWPFEVTKAPVKTTAKPVVGTTVKTTAKPAVKPAVKPISSTAKPVNPVHPGGITGDPGVAPPSPSTHPNARLLPTDICGLDYTQRIFGGNATDLDEFPWTALLQYENRAGVKRFRCGGVLISKRYVLTAAHCTSKADLNGYKPVAVRLGEHNTETEKDCDPSFCADPPLDFNIEREIVHPDYNYREKNKYNDIALFRLSSDVPRFTDYVRPICIPLDPEVKVKNYVGKNLTVAGWGRTEEASSSPVKLKANLPVVPNAECALAYQPKRQEIIDKQICAGGMRERDVCQGDSGGPMMSADYLERDQKVHYHVAGIVSFGPQCSLSEQNVKWIPGVYTRIAQYSTWILDQLAP